MLPGPDITMACGFCRGPVLKGSLLSGNTFNSTLWSDGKLHAPMNPGGKLLVKCPHCDALLLPADLNHTDTGWGGVTPRDDVEAARVESIEPEAWSLSEDAGAQERRV